MRTDGPSLFLYVAIQVSARARELMPSKSQLIYDLLLRQVKAAISEQLGDN